MLKKSKKIAWRLEAFSFLIITSLIGGAWVFLQSPSVSTVVEHSPQPTAVVAQKFVPQSVQPAIEKRSLSERLDLILNEYKADTTVSIAIVDLETLEFAGLREDRAMKAASLYKLFAANEVYRQLDTNMLERTDMIEDCLYRVIAVSDNTCGMYFQRLIGAVSTELPELKQQGFTNTDLRGEYPSTSASDVVALFASIYSQSYLSKASNAQFIESLKAQTITNRLPAQLPMGTVVAHKTADLEGYVHDAGIVYGATPYAIAILTEPDGSTYDERYIMIASLSRNVYDAILNTD